MSPLRIDVEVKADENNSKQLFSAMDIHLTDETGAEWRSFSSIGLTQNNAVFFFESNYFHNPRELYIEGEWFRALDRDKMEIVIDTERQQLIKAPDSLLKLKGVSSGGHNNMKITLGIKVDHVFDNRGYRILDPKFKDASGKEYEMDDVNGTAWSTRAMSNDQESYHYIENKEYVQPLTFRVEEYPNYIHQPYKIRIK